MLETSRQQTNTNCGGLTRAFGLESKRANTEEGKFTLPFINVRLLLRPQDGAGQSTVEISYLAAGSTW